MDLLLVEPVELTQFVGQVYIALFDEPPLGADDVLAEATLPLCPEQLEVTATQLRLASQSLGLQGNLVRLQLVHPAEKGQKFALLVAADALWKLLERKKGCLSIKEATVSS